MMFSPDVERRLLHDRQRDLRALAHPSTRRPIHTAAVSGHGDPLTARPVTALSWLPQATPKVRSVFRLALQGVACWESCTLAREAQASYTAGGDTRTVMEPEVRPQVEPVPDPEPVCPPSRELLGAVCFA